MENPVDQGGGRSAPVDTGNPANAKRSDFPCLPESVRHWLVYLRTQRRYSDHTLSAYRRDLQHLLDAHPGVPLDSLTESHIRMAIGRLHSRGLAPRSLARALAAWRGYFQWRAPMTGLSSNPVAGVRAPKAPRSLPKALSVEHAQVLLDRPGLPQAHTALECRDQAMFEVLYSSGMRLAELVSLDSRYTRTPDYESTSWLQLAEGEAVVRGKGNKTRSLPLGGKAITALQRWLELRPQLLTERTAGSNHQAALFLGARGQRISPRVVQLQLNKLATLAGLPVRVHPHSLRHSFASHMLQSAQDLRAVQELLGHANISTTQIYTRLDFQHLAQAYDQAHPRAKRK